jgi:transcriptional regulator with XRE-family HTH domain
MGLARSAGCIMSDDPIMRIPIALGRVIKRLRIAGALSAETISRSSGLSVEEINGIERGEREATFTEFFWLARALREEPAILFTDVIAAWRGDGGDSALYKSRPSEFTRLFRLGYYHKAGDFREQDRTYLSEAAAIYVAGQLNEQRHARGVAKLDTITLYIRMGYSHFKWSPGDGKVQP